MSNYAVNYRPLPKQHEFLNSNAHFNAFIAGIGSGKSLTGAHRGVRAAFGRVGDKTIPTPNTGMVLAPTYDMVNLIVVPVYEDILGYEDKGGLIRQYNKSERVMTLVNGSKIVFRSTDDPEKLRGPNLSWIHMDEAAMMSEQVWKICFGRVRQAGIFGYIWLTSTPAGRNWIYQKFVKDARPSYQLTKMHTFDNIFLADELILELALEYGGDFAKQELGGEFIAWQGLIYPEFTHDRHIFHTMPDLSNYQYTVAGVDWGFASPGTCLVFGVDSDGRMDLLHQEYAKRRPIEEWATTAYQLTQMYGVQTFYCDPSKPDYIDKFIEAGCNAVAANNTVDTGIQEVRKKLMLMDGQGIPHLRVHQSAVETITEFSNYIWLTRKIRGEGEVTQDVPKKAKDHTMDAIRYAVMGTANHQGYYDIQVNTRRIA